MFSQGQVHKKYIFESNFVSGATAALCPLHCKILWFSLINFVKLLVQMVFLHLMQICACENQFDAQQCFVMLFHSVISQSQNIVDEKRALAEFSDEE